MEKSDIRYKTYVDILKRELLPAMGCTEPIAIAYCAARARALLGCIPDSVLIEASGNIIKKCKKRYRPQHKRGQGNRGCSSCRHHRRKGGAEAGGSVTGN
ncbi:hypothetical protein CL3_23630 [butyrate-producing bacterium SM4/1]|nr:hypothetical protein CL3_23630 [butyrate-producing bacterium SM4/1]